MQTLCYKILSEWRVFLLIFFPVTYCRIDGVKLHQTLDINSTLLDSIAIRPHLIRLTQIVLVHLTWPKYLLAKLPCSKSCSGHTWMMHSYSGKDKIKEDFLHVLDILCGHPSGGRDHEWGLWERLKGRKRSLTVSHRLLIERRSWHWIRQFWEAKDVSELYWKDTHEFWVSFQSEKRGCNLWLRNWLKKEGCHWKYIGSIQ